MNRIIRIIAGVVLLAFVPLANAQDTGASPGQSRVATRLATSFSTVAGSQENALAIVNALRNGTAVTLLAAPATGTGAPVATTFTPPTRPMGWGNVAHALSLAQDSLSRLGITNPTNAQLQAALIGGNVTAADGSTVTLQGVLQMRAGGMGWGQIAKASGTTMGAVTSSTKAMQGKIPATATATASTTAASSGITTAAGSSVAAVAGNASKGITTASGVSSPAASRGLVTAEGAISTHGRSAGLTTNSASAGQGYGVGLVSATGAPVSANASITSAAGSGNGRGQGIGKGRGG